MSRWNDPIRIGPREAKNRIVRAATAERLATADGGCPDEMASFLERLAKGEVGVIVTGHLYVHPAGRRSDTQAGIDSDARLLGLSRLTESCHRWDALVFAQLSHAGRLARPGVTLRPAVGPSPVPPGPRVRPCQELDAAGIGEVVDAFGRAAERARDTGFDGVEVHAGHGFLIHQFLSPRTNRRTDAWGGDIGARAKLLLDVLAEIRRRVGDTYPVSVRMNVEDFVEGGLTILETRDVARLLAKAAVTWVDLTGGVLEEPESVCHRDVRTPEQEAYFLPQAQAIRPLLPCLASLNGGIKSLATIDRLLTDERFDMVSLGRPLVREPDLPRRFRRVSAARCISCNLCLGHPESFTRCWAPPDAVTMPKPVFTSETP